MWTKNTTVYARALKMGESGANLKVATNVAKKWTLNT